MAKLEISNLDLGHLSDVIGTLIDIRNFEEDFHGQVVLIGIQ